MNKDINRTLMALVPILRMNGEMVKSIEAVNDWYKVGEHEYLKEVAEITYDNGTRRYADIGCDSNLTAVYDVIAVIQQIKPRSSAIERIERGVYRQYPIESIPAADVQTLVQCRECKRWDTDNITGSYPDGVQCFCIKLSGGLMRRYTAPDDFCCWGERKEEKEEAERG